MIIIVYYNVLFIKKKSIGKIKKNIINHNNTYPILIPILFYKLCFILKKFYKTIKKNFMNT